MNPPASDNSSSPDTTPVTHAPPHVPLRIIQYSPGMRLSLGGVVRAVLDLCAVLAARGNEVVLATYDSPDLPPDWDGSPGKPNVVWIDQASRPNWFVSSAAVRSFSRLLTPGSVVHMHTPWTASNLQMARAARRANVPYLVSIHGMLNDWSMRQRSLKKRFFLNVGGRSMLTRADRVHYTAAAERDQAQKWIPGARAAVAPCLIDLADFNRLPGPELARERFSFNPAVPVLLFLSRIHEKKGIHILIDAANLLRQSGRTFKLIIAGSAAVNDRDYEQSLHEKVRAYNLESQIHFAGMVTGPLKLSLYQAADLFVLPTLQENFGLVLLEAMAAGCPVLTTRGTDIWQELAAAGATIAENTPEKLCEAIGRLLDDRTALAAVGRRARAWALSEFSTDRLAADYEKLYATVIGEHGER